MQNLFLKYIEGQFTRTTVQRLPSLEDLQQVIGPHADLFLTATQR